MATFVLVHGAWHGGWCYGRVAKLLRSAGHEVYTPAHTGVGERAHLADYHITLATHVHDVANVIEYENLSDVILCGHSYGGMVITGVAASLGERIKSLVYLDAFVPEDGQSLFDLIEPDMVNQFLNLARTMSGRLPPIPAAAFNVNPKDAAWVDKTCVTPGADDVHRRRALQRQGRQGEEPHLHPGERLRHAGVQPLLRSAQGRSEMEGRHRSVRSRRHG